MTEYHLERYELPTPLADLKAVQSIVRQHEIFCALSLDMELYECLTWRRQTAHHGTTVFALFDRNVLRDVLDLVTPAASGLPNECSERGRIGAATMAFLQCSNIIIEPSIALYENPSRAPYELQLFRRADEVDARLYTSIALGRSREIPPTALPAARGPTPAVDFGTHIRGRRNLTVATLKIAELELSDLPPIQKMEHFLQWSYSDFLFLVGPLLLAAAYFSPHREASVIKNLRSADRQRAITSVNNAVWDLLVIHQWVKRVKRQPEENSIWLLCSRDRALRRIARCVLCKTDDPAAAETELRQFFELNWGLSDGTRLVNLLLKLQHDQANPARMAHRSSFSNFADCLAVQLESKILEWNPE